MPLPLSDLIDPHLGSMLMDAAGEPRFGPHLLATAQAIDRVTEVFGYRLSPSGRPEALVSCSEYGDVEHRAGAYVARFYRNDPAIWARRGGVDGGFSERVDAREIAIRDYRAICFERPRFADKVSFGWRSAGEEIVVSFYRDRAGELGDPDRLRGLANIALTGLVRAARRLPARAHDDDIVARLERGVAAAAPGLSRREREVCARTLAGRSAAQTAADLGIGAATVLTYRQRAYGKLGLNRANDLLSALIR